jgi:hypothetical protein
MSDGMSDANALGRLVVTVETCADDLAKALYAARVGHRGIGVDGFEHANDVLRIYGLRLVAEPDHLEQMERSARLLRWGREP